MTRSMISALAGIVWAAALYGQAASAAASPAAPAVTAPPGGATGRTAVISVQSAIVGTKDGQKAAQELETKFGPKRKEMEARQNEIRQLQEQMQKGGNLMAEDKKGQLARDIDEKNKRLQRDTQDAQEELDQEQQRLLQGIGQRMLAVIEKYAKDNGYAMVLDVSNPNTPVLYASSGIDITQDIIALYDKQPATPAPTAAPGTGNVAKPTSIVQPGARTTPPGTPR